MFAKLWEKRSTCLLTGILIASFYYWGASLVAKPEAPVQEAITSTDADLNGGSADANAESNAPAAEDASQETLDPAKVQALLEAREEQLARERWIAIFTKIALVLSILALSLNLLVLLISFLQAITTRLPWIQKLPVQKLPVRQLLVALAMLTLCAWRFELGLTMGLLLIGGGGLILTSLSWLINKYLRTDSKVPLWAAWAIGLLPFVLVGWLYLWGADHIRELELTGGDEATASSKLIPTPEQMVEGFKRVAMEPDPKGNLRLWIDTWASTKRFAIGMAIVSTAIIFGLFMGCFPFLESLFYRILVFWDKVPPLLLLPILFIVFDTGELSKVALIVIGVFPGVVLDAYARAKEIQPEQLYKSQTLGASEFEIAWSIVLPQIFPKMLGSLRLNFKAAWGYVIAGESIAAAVGIGYRVFVLRRYVAMDIIIPYVLWATLMIFALDYFFQWWESKFRWSGK